MIFVRILFLISLAQLSACASHTSDVNSKQLKPMQTLSEKFLLKRNPKNHTISLLKDNNPSLLLYKKTTNSQTLEEVAVSFLQRHRKDFLIKNPAAEFKTLSNKTDDLGFTRIKLAQVYQGIPVWNGIISAHFNRQGELQIVRGEYFPTPDNIDIKAGMSSDALFQTMSAIDPNITNKNYKLAKIIYPLTETTPRLAYELQPVGHAKLASYTYIIDAMTGDILNRQSNIQTLR